MKVVFAALVLACCQAWGAVSFDPGRVSKVVEAAHAAGEFDGAVAIVKDGKVVYSTAIGEADRARHIPNRVETIYRLASLTKQVTALLVMREVSAGRLFLSTKAGEILPSLPESSGRVTVQQLLQHVSGLPNPSDGPEGLVPPFYTRTDAEAASMSQAARGFCSGQAKRGPGGQFEYNNCDYIVLGALLEKLNGTSYSELVEARVIKPLKLSSWGLFASDPTKAPAAAVGYMNDGSTEPMQNPGTYGAAGGLYGIVRDVAKWDMAVLSNQLLNAAATARMFQADPKLYGEALGSWAYDVKSRSGVEHVVERQGDMGGTRLLNLLLPGRNMALIIIGNTERADLFDTYSKKGLGYRLLCELLPE